VWGEEKPTTSKKRRTPVFRVHSGEKGNRIPDDFGEKGSTFCALLENLLLKGIKDREKKKQGVGEKKEERILKEAAFSKNTPTKERSSRERTGGGDFWTHLSEEEKKESAERGKAAVVSTLKKKEVRRIC